MRIVHVVRQFPPSVGGLEEAVLKLGQTLAERGFDIRVVTLDRVARGGPERLPPIDNVGGLAVRRIPFRGSWRYPVAPGVLGAIRDADLVHVHGIDFFFDFLALTRPLHGKPLVASTHGGFFHTAFARRAKRVFFATVTRASATAYGALCASSQSDHDLFRPIAGRRLVLAPNGVDTAKWSGAGSVAATKRLIYVGRFSTNKNLTALFPVLGALRRRDPAWSLTLAGRPWDVAVGDLRVAAGRAGVVEAVTFVEAPDDAAVRRHIATASYVVSPSRHEGFGLSVVEGLSAGLVPLLSPIPPFASLVRDGGVGRTLDFDRPDEAAAAIEAQHAVVTRDPAGSRAAAIRAARPYSWSAGADAVQRAYDMALNDRSTSRHGQPARLAP